MTDKRKPAALVAALLAGAAALVPAARADGALRPPGADRRRRGRAADHRLFQHRQDRRAGRGLHREVRRRGDRHQGQRRGPARDGDPRGPGEERPGRRPPDQRRRRPASPSSCPPASSRAGCRPISPTRSTRATRTRSSSSHEANVWAYNTAVLRQVPDRERLATDRARVEGQGRAAGPARQGLLHRLVQPDGRRTATTRSPPPTRPATASRSRPTRRARPPPGSSRLRRQRPAPHRCRRGGGAGGRRSRPERPLRRDDELGQVPQQRRRRRQARHLRRHGSPGPAGSIPSLGLIATGTDSPNAAKLFIHYLLTEEGIAPQAVDGKMSINADAKLPADEPSGIAAVHRPDLPLRRRHRRRRLGRPPGLAGFLADQLREMTPHLPSDRRR